MLKYDQCLIGALYCLVTIHLALLVMHFGIMQYKHCAR